jgi:hypothetical protein
MLVIILLQFFISPVYIPAQGTVLLHFTYILMMIGPPRNILEHLGAHRQTTIAPQQPGIFSPNMRLSELLFVAPQAAPNAPFTNIVSHMPAHSGFPALSAREHYRIAPPSGSGAVLMKLYPQTRADTENCSISAVFCRTSIPILSEPDLRMTLRALHIGAYSLFQVLSLPTYIGIQSRSYFTQVLVVQSHVRSPAIINKSSYFTQC